MSISGRINGILRRIEEVPARALPRAATRVQAHLREDATTRRGNVPGFGELGGPITAAPTDDGVSVKAPGWVHDIAAREGQPASWSEDLADEVSKALDEGT